MKAVKFKELERRALALPLGGEGAEEIIRICLFWDCIYKRRIFSAIAWATDMTHDEIGKIDSELWWEAKYGKK